MWRNLIKGKLFSCSLLSVTLKLPIFFPLRCLFLNLGTIWHFSRIIFVLEAVLNFAGYSISSFILIHNCQLYSSSSVCLFRLCMPPYVSSSSSMNSVREHTPGFSLSGREEGWVRPCRVISHQLRAAVGDPRESSHAYAGTWMLSRMLWSGKARGTQEVLTGSASVCPYALAMCFLGSPSFSSLFTWWNMTLYSSKPHIWIPSILKCWFQIPRTDNVIGLVSAGYIQF